MSIELAELESRQAGGQVLRQTVVEGAVSERHDSIHDDWKAEWDVG